MLRWIGEQYVVPRDLLSVLLGRHSEYEAARAAGRVTDTVVDRTLRRWRDLGLAHSRSILVGESAAVWPTWRGLRFAGLEYRATKPSLATLPHRYAVARVRAAIEGRDPTIEWICERELREGLRGRRAHIPDGVVVSERGRTAIEVELTPKTQGRLREILWRVLADYDRVVYYAAPRPAEVVTRAAGDRLKRRQVVVRPYPLPVDPPLAQPA